MSTYKTVYTEVEVDVDISEFDTEDLIDELESRGSLQVDGNIDAKELVEKIWLKRRLGNHDYQDELDKLIYSVLGKIV
jgi:CBS domain containing-hemolysin-like protein